MKTGKSCLKDGCWSAGPVPDNSCKEFRSLRNIGLVLIVGREVKVGFGGTEITNDAQWITRAKKLNRGL